MVRETRWRNGMKRMAVRGRKEDTARRWGVAKRREEKEQTWRLGERRSELKMEKRKAKDHKKPTVLVSKVIEHPYWYTKHTYFICLLHIVGYIMSCSCTIKGKKKKTLERNARALMYKESLIRNQNHLLPAFKWHAASWFSWKREMESTQHLLHSCHPVMLLRCVPSVMQMGNITDLSWFDFRSDLIKKQASGGKLVRWQLRFF